MTFKAVIHPEPAGGYWGEAPALPGCYSQGETVEQPQKAGQTQSGFNEFFHTQSPSVTFFRSPLEDTILPPSSVPFQPTE